jgi:hypothetical protein
VIEQLEALTAELGMTTPGAAATVLGERLLGPLTLEGLRTAGRRVGGKRH